LDSPQWRELIGPPMCAPSTDKTSFLRAKGVESVFGVKYFKRTKDGEAVYYDIGILIISDNIQWHTQHGRIERIPDAFRIIEIQRSG
jgi:hypothetical protein